MKWFYNMKISAKLIIGFIVIALMSGVVGIVGLANMGKIVEADKLLYKENTLGLNYAGSAAIYFQRIRFISVKLVLSENLDELDESSAQIMKNRDEVDKNLMLYEEGAIDQDFADLKTGWKKYKDGLDRMLACLKQEDIIKAKNMVFGELAESGNKLEQLYDKVFYNNCKVADLRQKLNQTQADSAKNIMIGVILGAILIAAVLGYILSKIICKPMKDMIASANRIAQGDISVDISCGRRDEVGILSEAFSLIVENIRRQADAVQKISEGNLDLELKVRSESDVLNNGLNRMIMTLKTLINEMQDQYYQQSKGDIDAEIDANKFKGVYKDVAIGINDGYGLHRRVILRILNILAQYAEGDFSAVLEELPGKQAVANEKMNLLRDNLLNLINEMLILSKAATDGDLSIRGNAEKFRGDYKKIIDGINNTLNEVLKPINEASRVLEEISSGNLAVSVEGNYMKDHAIIKKAINNSVESFNEVLGNIISASEQVASGSKQVSNSSIALSQGATQQASSIEELTTSLEEISSQTNLNAQNANEASKLAESAKINAVQGNDLMNEMLAAMKDIEEASTKVCKIIKVIDDIAFQTNILALNAAVEAARAGQHGKGFAVVAEEVRNLAARSANAAKETTDMIEGSIRKVDDGTKITKETAEALKNIVNGVEKVASLVGDIAIASTEQATAIGQINQGVMQVSQVVQSNSATSQESAAASEELSSQAALLKDMVGKFKLKREGRAYGTVDSLNPEMIRMLEAMAKKNNQDSRSSFSGAENGRRIILNDKEFGKY